MRIAFDIMGGDNAPAAIIEGVLALARSYPQDELIMVGLDSAVTDIPSLPDRRKQRTALSRHGKTSAGHRTARRAAEPSQRPRYSA